MAEGAEGVFKCLRGGYGCGKTFLARLLVQDAQARGFATSFVVVSDNDLHFYKFDDVYRKVVQSLGTASCPQGALGDIVDRWIARVEAGLVAGGADEAAPGFDEQVAQRLEEEIAAMTGGKAPEDLGRALRAVFALKQEGKIAEAGAVLSWLSGSANVAASARKRAGVKGDVRHVIFEAAHGFTSNVPLAEATAPAVMVTYRVDGKPFATAHGAPVRALVPDLYFWKSAKWLTGIKFVARDEPGFWEVRGYHNHADPWREERYG